MIEQTVIDEIKVKNPDAMLRLVELTHDDKVYEFICKIPSLKQYRELFKSREKDFDYANNGLVYECIKYPKKPDLYKLFQEHPGFVANLSSELLALAGTRADMFVNTETKTFVIKHDEEEFSGQLTEPDFISHKQWEQEAREDMNKANKTLVAKFAILKDVSAMDKYPAFQDLIVSELVLLSGIAAKSVVKKL